MAEIQIIYNTIFNKNEVYISVNGDNETIDSQIVFYLFFYSETKAINFIEF